MRTGQKLAWGDPIGVVVWPAIGFGKFRAVDRIGRVVGIPTAPEGDSVT